MHHEKEQTFGSELQLSLQMLGRLMNGPKFELDKMSLIVNLQTAEKTCQI